MLEKMIAIFGRVYLECLTYSLAYLTAKQIMHLHKISYSNKKKKKIMHLHKISNS